MIRDARPRHSPPDRAARLRRTSRRARSGGLATDRADDAGPARIQPQPATTRSAGSEAALRAHARLHGGEIPIKRVAPPPPYSSVRILDGIDSSTIFGDGETDAGAMVFIADPTEPEPPHYVHLGR